MGRSGEAGGDRARVGWEIAPYSGLIPESSTARLNLRISPRWNWAASAGADPTAVDPEEALVAAVSSCHMLFFLAIARKHGLTITVYEDEAEGVMSPNAAGKLFISTITLRPRITFDGPADPAVVDQVHHLAHDECYLAHSVRADILIQPR